ncbi:2OG-Fe(II) oxygenase [Phycobacter azelaicus]|uniref:2OG-Fe(II) oxygenase n=1 Tax=Phycobacter azelaicus TaxID=2668075 RepID=UPI001865ED98|nr:hypothetical protein [Paracoccaceae bacterium]
MPPPPGPIPVNPPVGPNPPTPPPPPQPPAPPPTPAPPAPPTPTPTPPPSPPDPPIPGDDVRFGGLDSPEEAIAALHAANTRFDEPEYEWIFKARALQPQKLRPLDHVFVEDFLTDAECDWIIERHQKLALDESRMSWGERDEHRRSTDLYWLQPDEVSYPLFQKVAALVAEVNDKEFRYDLFGYIRPMQLGRYSMTQGYDWHQDIGPAATSKRKLSVCIQLSNPAEYEGGHLELFRAESDALALPRKRGSVAVFPSWVLHRVTPVTAGTRWSLVSWVEGPPLR